MHKVKHLVTIQRDHNPQRKSTQQHFYTYHDISAPTHRWTRGLNGNHQMHLLLNPPFSVAIWAVGSCYWTPFRSHSSISWTLQTPFSSWPSISYEIGTIHAPFIGLCSMLYSPSSISILCTLASHSTQRYSRICNFFLYACQRNYFSFSRVKAHRKHHH
jgi:hypothetical protein